MEIRYTNHAREKLADEEYLEKFSITKELVKTAVLTPESVEELEDGLMRATRAISQRLSLVVIYMQVGEDYLVITIYPARRGRYES